ncbi:hypothetical protein CRYUN_Cryun05aG0234300 [Craigia yunnanensis]
MKAYVSDPEDLKLDPSYQETWDDMIINLLAESLDVIQDTDCGVISLGNVFTKQYALYMPDDENSALLHRTAQSLLSAAGHVTEKQLRLEVLGAISSLSGNTNAKIVFNEVLVCAGRDIVTKDICRLRDGRPMQDAFHIFLIIRRNCYNSAAKKIMSLLLLDSCMDMTRGTAINRDASCLSTFYTSSKVGVDNMCILLHDVKQQPLELPLEERISNALVEIDLSITLSSLSEFFTFSVGCFTPMPECSVFSFFAVFDCLNAEDNRINCFPCIKIPSAAGESNEGMNSRGAGLLARYMQEMHAPFLGLCGVKLVVIAVFVAFASASIGDYVNALLVSQSATLASLMPR